MADTKVQEFYNGKEWIRVTSQPLYNEEGKPTGHYKELEREYVSKLGVLDNEKVIEETITAINNLRSATRENFYILQGNTYVELYKTYSSTPAWNSIGDAVIDFFRQHGFLVDEVRLLETSIIFICHIRGDEESFSMVFSGANMITQQVP